jgi:hypothetical protein
MRLPSHGNQTETLPSAAGLAPHRGRQRAPFTPTDAPETSAREIQAQRAEAEGTCGRTRASAGASPGAPTSWK